MSVFLLFNYHFTINTKKYKAVFQVLYKSSFLANICTPYEREETKD